MFPLVFFDEMSTDSLSGLAAIASGHGLVHEKECRPVLRKAQFGDMEAIRKWRNHAEVRRVSLTQHAITADEHRSWWERTQEDPSTLVLIYERDGLAAGVITFFDLKDRSAWWGYYLDNDGLTERGTLFPAWISIQREAVRYARDELGLVELHGETLAANESAVAFNERQGFTEVERYTRDVAGRLCGVIHSRRTFEEENHG